jgi:uncharacterized membrane protein YbhN (UPF0104 family)
MKVFFLVFVKILISFLFLFFIFKNIDVQSIKKTISHLNIFYFIFACFLNIVSIFYAATRLESWNFLHKFSCFRITYIAAFLGQIFPGALSGDAYRAYDLKRNNFLLKDAIKLLFSDRLMGLFGLFFLGFVCSLFTKPIICLINFFVVFLCIIFAFINEKKKFLFSFFQKKTLKLSITSAFFYLFASWIVSLSTNMPLSCIEIFSFFPVLIFVSNLPISLAGWGVRELLMIAILKNFNITANDALSFSVVFGIMKLLSTMPALLCFFKKRPSFSAS